MSTHRPLTSPARDVPEAVLRAAAAIREGDDVGAERWARLALDAKPDSVEALQILAVVAGRRGRAEEAAELLARVLRANPSDVHAHYNRGVALGQLGRHEEALACYESALALQPGHVDAHFNRGVSLDRLERRAEALASYERVIGLQPGYAEAHNNRGVALASLGRVREAVDSYDRAIALRPGYASAYNNRGSALRALGRLAEAVESYGRALELRPDYPEAQCNLAIVLLDVDRPAEAFACCERVLALRPDHAEAWYNAGNALRELHRYAEAAERFERAIALRPDHGSAHWNLADCRLIQGDFARGWEQYARRGKPPGPAPAQREFAAPLWQGTQPLDGRTILLHPEMGMGDTLLFCRYAKKVAALGARVLLEAQAPLLPLLRGLEGPTEVLAAGTLLPPFDFHCPLMSLPCAFRSDLRSIPAEVPYLRSDPVRVAAWRERIGPAAGQPRIGVAWSGSGAIRNDKRSMLLPDLLPLVGGWAEWVSLQKELSEADAELIATRADIRHFGPELADFADTAALVELVDLVVTIDTSVANLAGAMGKPVWIMLPFAPHDWRWLLDREDSPWYPTARLFRQSSPGDWRGVVQRVGEELARRYRA